MDTERNAREEQPLLSPTKDAKRPHAINLQNWLYPHTYFNFTSSREAVRHRLSSKYWHYFVLGLVCLDVASTFASFIIQLFRCEKKWGNIGWGEALNALSIIGLVFSSLFVVELLASVWAFGWTYFKSTFHTFDALVIILGFCLDIVLRGTIEEAASLIIVLRLWRVFQIIEELTAGAQEEIDNLSEKIVVLEGENDRLRNDGGSAKRALEGENGKLRMEMDELRRRLQFEERKNGEGSRKELQETPPTPD